MHGFRRLIAPLAVSAALVIVPALAYAASTISISGATASFPLITQLAAAYTKTKHGTVAFKISQGGTTVGIQEAASGKVDIGDSSRPPQPPPKGSDPPGLLFYPIAKYFVCVVTNPANPISNLTPLQVQQIFTGRVRDWSQVSGAKATGTIDVYTRTSVAGVLTTFQNALLGGAKVSPVASQQATEGLMANSIKKDPSAIGFLSDYFTLAKGIHAVAYNGVGCTVANVVSNTYPGFSYFYEVTRGKATGPAAVFINWIQHSPLAKKIIEKSWIPLNP